MVRPYDSHEGRTRADAASAVRPYHFLKTKKPAPAIVKRMIVAMELLSVAVRLAHNGVGHARTNTADMGRLPLLYTVVGQKERLRIKVRRFAGGGEEGAWRSGTHRMPPQRRSAPPRGNLSGNLDPPACTNDVERRDASPGVESPVLLKSYPCSDKLTFSGAASVFVSLLCRDGFAKEAKQWQEYCVVCWRLWR